MVCLFTGKPISGERDASNGRISANYFILCRNRHSYICIEYHRMRLASFVKEFHRGELIPVRFIQTLVRELVSCVSISWKTDSYELHPFSHSHTSSTTQDSHPAFNQICNCSLLFSYNSLPDSCGHSCSFAKKHQCRLSPFLFLFALSEIMGVPHDCMSLDLFSEAASHSPIFIPWSQETWSSLSFISTAFSSHCFSCLQCPIFTFQLCVYVNMCPPTILCVTPYYSLNHLLPLRPFMGLALHPKYSQYSRLNQNFHFIVNKWNIFLIYFTSVLVEAPSLWKFSHAFCPIDHWIHDVSYLFEYALYIK